VAFQIEIFLSFIFFFQIICWETRKLGYNVLGKNEKLQGKCCENWQKDLKEKIFYLGTKYMINKNIKIKIIIHVYIHLILDLTETCTLSVNRGVFEKYSVFSFIYFFL